MKKIYIAGPMTGIPEHNFPAFFQAARRLREQGYEVVSPAELDQMVDGPPGSRTWDYYLRRDLKQLLGCEGVAVLPGWERSQGATLEVEVACRMQMFLIDAFTLESLSVKARSGPPTTYTGVTGVAFSGKAGAGKTTLQKLLIQKLTRQGHDCLAVNFADPLKRILAKVKGEDPQQAGEQAWKLANRTGLQRLGQSGREEQLDIWVNILLSKVRPGQIVSVGDLRFPNEALALRGAGFKLIRLEASRELRGARITLSGDEHESEVALDSFKGWDMVFDQDNNPRTPEYYVNRVISEFFIPARPYEIRVDHEPPKILTS